MLAVGPVVRDNLLNLGHLDFKADGRTEPKLPGDVCVRVGDLPLLRVGDPFRIIAPCAIEQGAPPMSYRERLQQRLDETGAPLRVGLVGAGQMGTGFAAQLLRMPGIALSAVLDVDRDRAVDALGQSGIKPSDATDVDAASQAIESGGSVALAGVDELGGLPLDVVVEATGVPDVGARVAHRGAARRARASPP